MSSISPFGPGPGARRRVRSIHLRFGLVAAVVVCTLVGVPLRAQTIGNYDRDRGRTILNVIKNDLKKQYYDPTFHGIDIDARFKTAEDRISQAASNGQIFAIVAQALLDLNDSHTRFIPPARSVDVEYGVVLQMVGDACRIEAVKPGSDAETKGIAMGDEVLAVEGFRPTRRALWKMQYSFYLLRPQPTLTLDVRKPDGTTRKVQVAAAVKQLGKLQDLSDATNIATLIRELDDEDQLNRHRYYENLEGVFVWKMPAFDLAEQQVDRIFGDARKRSALVIDMRGNGGGLEKMLLRVIGNLFDHDVKVGDAKMRSKSEPVIARTRGADAFKGKLVVLVDSESGSAAELLARVVQIEKRGAVLGDRSAGAVMRSRFYSHEFGSGTVVFYGASVTEADLVMTDGKSLEGVGVVPDELLLPTAADMAAGRDPVLARAAEAAGATLTPEKAGMLFPREWKK